MLTMADVEMEMTARLGLKGLRLAARRWRTQRRNGDDSPVGIESRDKVGLIIVFTAVEMEMTARLGLKVAPDKYVVRVETPSKWR